MLLACLSLSAQDMEPKDTQQQPVDIDSMRYTLKQRELIQQRAELEEQIRQEDARRGAIADGAILQEQEAANLKQDSICLALRSRLTDIDLELAELNERQQVADTATQPSQPTTGATSAMQRIIQTVREDRK